MTPEEARHLGHELRTPVNHIAGYSDLLREDPCVPASLSEVLVKVGALAVEANAAIGLLLEDGQGPAAVEALAAVVGALREVVNGLPEGANEAQNSDIGRIVAAVERLHETVEGLGRPPAPARTGAGGGRVEAMPGENARQPLILVVDDDEANRDLLVRRLARLGYSTAEARDGAQALELLHQRAVDLVLLDVMMPVMDGYAVLEERRHDAMLRDIPVVMISALDQVESVVRCIEAGADDYLPKPFDPVLLQARVGACLEKKQLRDQEKALLARVRQQSDELRGWNAELERRVEEKVRVVERLSLVERFVPPQLATMIASGSADLLKSHRRDITVLFCDLRGFTPFSETAEPEDVMAVLGELHTAVGPLIFEFQGTLAYFTGDGLMVFFNDPVPCDEPAWAAVQLGLRMQDEAGRLAHSWRGRGHELALGVGIASGFATCGQIGFGGRFEYTAIGSVTNLAARLCGEAGGGQVLVSQRVFALVEGRVAAEPAGALVLKGFARPVTAFSVLAAP